MRPLTTAERVHLMMISGCYRAVASGLERRCPTCGEWKPFTPEFFPRRRKAPLGLSGGCKPCNVVRVHRYQ